MANLKKLFYNHREILLYIFFGGFTTVVSIGSFVLFDNVLHIHELIANALSWIFAVGVAYGTNRRWVFCSKATGKAMWTEACAFYGGRLFTLMSRHEWPMSRSSIKQLIFEEIGGVKRSDQQQADLIAAINYGFLEESTIKQKGYYMLQPPEDLPF